MGEVAAWDVKRSHFNAKVRMENCGVCGETAEEAHHIIPQGAANKKGIILRHGTPVHKNTESNIVPLCGSCHDKHHAGKIKIEGWVGTSDGRMLKWKDTTVAEDPSP